MEGVTYKIYKATKGGEFIGAAVESSANGFGGALNVLVGFDKEGNIIDYSLLSHAETPGLGSKAADWFKKGGKGDITGMNPGQKALVVNKDGGQIDAITASTITTRAFLKAVNNAYAAYSGQNVDGSSGATQQVSETAADDPKAAKAQCEELRIVADKPVTLLPAKLLVVVNVILLTATRRTVKSRMPKARL